MVESAHPSVGQTQDQPAAFAIFSGKTYRFERQITHVSGRSGLVLCRLYGSSNLCALQEDICNEADGDTNANREAEENHKPGFSESDSTQHATNGSARASLFEELRYVTAAEWERGVAQYEYARRRTAEHGLPNMNQNVVSQETADFATPEAEGNNNANPAITAYSPSDAKIQLFQSLLRGRVDVYAHGFLNRKTGKIGYAPAAWNEWKELPSGRRIPMPSDERRCKPLTAQVLERHFTQRDPKFYSVVGLYPMSQESRVWFLAIDFDDEGWQREITATRKVCEELGLSPAIERSRSGEGGHLWLFFEAETDATLARRMGSVLLSLAAERTHIPFRSYDRMFPNQDTLPAGGFGNLIALPLQKVARDSGNSVFIDEQFNPYPDQWSFLASVHRVSADRVREVAARAMSNGGPLGALTDFNADEGIAPRQPNAADSTSVKINDKEGDGLKNKTSPTTAGTAETTSSRQSAVRNPSMSSARFPRSAAHISLSSSDLPAAITVTERNMLAIDKAGMSAAACNAIRRLAAFANPDFYRTQAMRRPVYNKPRIIYCGEETDNDILLPRGCKEPLLRLLTAAGGDVTFENDRNRGRHIRAKFAGRLRSDQRRAMKTMLEHDDGVLVAPTGFGKTVIAVGIIARRKVNTLVVLRSSALLDQWRERLEQFLDISETVPPLRTKTGRISKRQRTIVGQIGAGRNEPSGIIDVALAQSLFEKGDVQGEKKVKDLVNNYGMVIFDECHHVAAVDMESIARQADARYVLGLTGTPKREDGLQGIMIMQCGPIRHTVEVSEQIKAQRFSRKLVPRFTSVRFELEELASYNDYLDVVCASDERNRMVIDDAVQALNDGRTPLVLSKRVAHAQMLARELSTRGCPHVILLHGGDSRKVQRQKLAQLAAIDPREQLAVVATGSYIGEGFDQKRFDTLLLASPVSFEGTLAQYVGRLHRDNEGKREVRVYDYIDVTVPMASSMYRKRLRAYAKQGYELDVRDGEKTQAVTHLKAQAQLKAQLLTAKARALRDNPADQAAGRNRNDKPTSANDDIALFSHGQGDDFSGVGPSHETDLSNGLSNGEIVTMEAFVDQFDHDLGSCLRTVTIAAHTISRQGLDAFDGSIMRAVARGIVVRVIVRLPAHAAAVTRRRIASSAKRLQALGCSVATVEACGDYAVLDDELVWFGGIALLGGSTGDDCSLRFKDHAVATRLLDSVGASQAASQR